MTIRFLLFFIFLSGSSFVYGVERGDNRYCGPGDEPKFGSVDGPATLPQSCFYTASSATPSPGKVIRVSADSNLQQAIERAECGDTLELTAGATYRGEFVFPAKSCDDRHWITVRTSGQLPPEGARMSPCYAGLDSFPGRPGYRCISPVKALATLVVPAKGMRVTDHYRFIGLEITRPEGTGITYNLVMAREANRVIFDRVWIHGTANDETTRGIAFPGATFFAIIDSYFSDFHCIARTGSCVDSQTMWAGTGPVAGGTYKIVNNYLEAAGEGVLMGGGAGSATPQDIEIRRNNFYKPDFWNPSSPQFHGPTFIVKNNFELKNASRVLFEGNWLENSWGGFSQPGFQILLTPKNQENKCPACIVRDATLRYCLLLHSGSGIQIASAASDAGGLSQGLMNLSIHDLVIEDVSARKYAGNGFMFQMSSSGGAFRNVSLRHLTAPVTDRQLLVIGAGERGSRMENISVVDSILAAGQYQMMSTGGRTNCAFGQRDPKDFFDACWAGYTVTGNLVVGGFDKWPNGNKSVQNLKSLALAPDEKDALTGLALPPDSQYHGKASDGKDPGADIPAVREQVADVQ